MPQTLATAVKCWLAARSRTSWALTATGSLGTAASLTFTGAYFWTFANGWCHRCGPPVDHPARPLFDAVAAPAMRLAEDAFYLIPLCLLGLGVFALQEWLRRRPIPAPLRRPLPRPAYALLATIALALIPHLRMLASTGIHHPHPGLRDLPIEILRRVFDLAGSLSAPLLPAACLVSAVLVLLDLRLPRPGPAPVGPLARHVHLVPVAASVMALIAAALGTTRLLDPHLMLGSIALAHGMAQYALAGLTLVYLAHRRALVDESFALNPDKSLALRDLTERLPGEPDGRPE